MCLRWLLESFLSVGSLSLLRIPVAGDLSESISTGWFYNFVYPIATELLHSNCYTPKLGVELL